VRRVLASLAVVAACGSRTPLVDVPVTEGDAEACAAPMPLALPSLATDSPTEHCGRAGPPEACPPPGAPTYGQDGSYRVRVPSYSVAGGVVTDSVTGLSWARDPGTPRAWDDADAYCAALSVDGARGFRLPDRVELSTLLDLGRARGTLDPSLGIDLSDPTPRSAGACAWSSSARGALGGSGSAVCFDAGNAAVAPAGPLASVRCVKGPQKVAGYTYRPGVAIDRRTGLAWDRAFSEPMSWQDALAYCGASRVAGACDWRVPSAKEALTLVQDTAALPPIDAIAFPDAPAETFWTSTLDAASGDANALGLSLGDPGASLRGQAGMLVSEAADGTALLRVRCVR
jgi:hypothetical protein